jgi:enamine deaminase RidA (YjgF/YER057c/UK114 family)
MSATRARTVHVEEEHDGSRLDNFLASLLPEHSRSQIQRLIKDGRVKGPAPVVRASTAVHTGQQFEVEVLPPVAAGPAAEELPLRIIYQDEDGVVLAPGDAAGQVLAALDAIEAVLAQAGARLEQVVQTRMYVTDISRCDEIGRAHGDRFGAIAPVTSMVQVDALIDPRMLVEIEDVAYLG